MCILTSSFDWFGKLDVPIKIQLLIAILTIVGWLAAFLIMIWQVNKTHERNLKLQDKLLQRQIEYEAYKDLQVAIKPTYLAFCEYQAYLEFLIEETSMSTATIMPLHYDWKLVRTELQRYHHSINLKHINLASIYQLKLIIFPKLEKTILEMMNTYNLLGHDMCQFVALSYPLDAQIPPKGKEMEFNEKIRLLSEKAKEMIRYLLYLDGELQTIVLGSLFDKKKVSKAKTIYPNINISKNSGEDELRPYAS